MADSRPPALEIDNLVQLYGSSQNGVRGLTMRVPARSVHGFLGRNGAGKTTTMKCIMGLLRAQEGEMRLFGAPYRPRRDLPLRLRIGYSPELPSFPAHLRAREVLELYGRMRGLGARELEGEIRYLSEHLGLQEVLTQRVRTLSKGTVARLGVGVAMLGDPDLLILDEPTSGLDPVAIAELRDLLLGLVRGSVGASRTVLLSSHQLGEAQRLCSSVTIIDRGVAVGEGPVDRLIEQVSGGAIYRVEFKALSGGLLSAVQGVPGVREVTSVPGSSSVIRIRASGDADPREDLARLALQYQALLLSCDREAVSLEDLFLAFVGHRGPPTALPAPSTGARGSGTGGATRDIACPRCGSNNAADSRFCRGCGSPLSAAVSGTVRPGDVPSPVDAPPASKKLCPGCGHENEWEYRFCQRCGRSLSSPVAAGPAG